MRWYCVFTQPHLERWARTNLWERDFEVYLPEYIKVRRHARRTDRVARSLFPRYLFVRVDLATGARRAIRTARGVVDLVAFGAAPPSVPDAVIAEIRSREGPDGYIAFDNLRRIVPGTKVRIVEGPFADLPALFESTNDDRRVFILLDLLGRTVRTAVDASSIVLNTD